MISYGSRSITSRRVSLVMKAIGYRSERNSKGCFYRLYDMDPTEAQHEISALFAEDEVVEEKKEVPTQPDLFSRSNDQDNDLPF